DRATVRRLRRDEPGKRCYTLRDDLHLLMRRRLEKPRDPLYGTPADQADDAHRHVRRETVQASRPSAAYRPRRVAQCPRAAVAAALIVGTIVSVNQTVRATRAEAVARAERDTATAAMQAEAVARADAQRRQEQAEDLLAFMLGDFRAGLQAIGRLELLDAV